MEDYTFASLVERVKRKLRDAEYDDDDIKAFLNEAQYEVLGEDRYPFLEKVDEYQSSEGGELDLPLDYQSTFQIYARRGKSGRSMLTYVPSGEFFGTKAAFTYTVFGNKVFYNLPRIEYDEDKCDCDESENFYQITHLYLAKPAEMEEDDDEPIIPREFSEILVLGALARAEQARDNFDFAQVYLNQQSNLMLDMKFRFGIKQQGAQNRARLPFRKMGGAFYGNH